MQTFKIRPEGFKEIKRRALVVTLPAMIIAVAAGLTISSINSRNNVPGINVLPVVIPLMAIAVGVGAYLGVNRQKKLIESYTLTFTNNLITREQLNTPTISIYFNEVIEIAKYKNGSFTIRGKDATDLIGIPAQIDNYLQLEATLQNIQSIVIKGNVSFLEKFQRFTGLATAALMVCVYTISNKIIVGVTGTALVVLMTWSFIKIRNSKNIDSKTKKSARWVLIVLVSVIAVMIFKLTGFVDMQKH